jgi:uncharacterized pyridoxal phosphate-containing UPF0001 family protein
MFIPPYRENPEHNRKNFRDMAMLFRHYKNILGDYTFSYLSMGMSGDFEIAIEEGANMVRIGTAIFGIRTV